LGDDDDDDVPKGGRNRARPDGRKREDGVEEDRTRKVEGRSMKC
jgi:hypothetical protein